jgi:hypothetical protein
MTSRGGATFVALLLVACSSDALDTATGVCPGGGDPSAWYEDQDGDGWGNAMLPQIACDAPEGTSALLGDCADQDATIHPGALERCNARDDDCSGIADDDPTDGQTFFHDQDGDGYGDPSATRQACAEGRGYVADGSDCDDGARDVHPGAAEICNGADEDCDTLVDEDAIDAEAWFPDDDLDGYGQTDALVVACDQPLGTVTEPGDCNDEDPTVNPSAGESCNGLDDDCDGWVDEDTGVVTLFEDADGDGWGDPDTAVEACDVRIGYVSNGLDCDDGNATVHPGATEQCEDGLDNDCSGGDATC